MGKVRTGAARRLRQEVALRIPKDQSEIRSRTRPGCRNGGGSAVNGKPIHKERSPAAAGLSALLSGRNRAPAPSPPESINAPTRPRAAVCRCWQIVTLPAFGVMLTSAVMAGKMLNAEAVNSRFVKPLDEAVEIEMAQSHDLLVALEDRVVMGRAGSAVNERLLSLGSRTPALNLRLLDGLPVQGWPPGAPGGLRSGYARQTNRPIQDRMCRDGQDVPGGGSAAHGGRQ